MSESMTAKRLWAARTARRYPVILQMVARGQLHLSAIAKLAKHLTEDNHRALLLRARHKSSRELDVLIAELAPRPDVPSRIRALPRSKGSTRSADSAGGSARKPADSCTLQRPGQTVASCRGVSTDVPDTADTVSVGSTRRPRGQVVPLAPRRYKIEVTVDQETHDKLRMLEDLLGHLTAGADPAVIVRRAIDRLFDETLKKKAAITDTARAGDRRADDRGHRPGDRRTRAIPAAIRREVWRRDGGRCTYVDRRGRRCRGTRCIEYHHEMPFGKGGQHVVGNIALRCRAHNQYQADLDFGLEFMRAKRGSNSSHSARNVDSKIAKAGAASVGNSATRRLAASRNEAAHGAGLGRARHDGIGDAGIRHGVGADEECQAEAG